MLNFFFLHQTSEIVRSIKLEVNEMETSAGFEFRINCVDKMFADGRWYVRMFGL